MATKPKVRGERKLKPVLADGFDNIPDATFVSEPAPASTERYEPHAIEVLKAARDAAVTVVTRLQKDLGSLRLATMIANGAEAKLEAFGAWLNRAERPDLPEGLREIALCGIVLHAKKIKKQKDQAEKAACSADVLDAYRVDLSHLEDLAHAVKGQLAFDWEAEVGADGEDEE